MSHFLEFRSITKTFPGVKALSDVSFAVDRGQVHGLLGENGAGKSTLLKILGGEYIPDGGQVMLDGTERHFTRSRDSIDAGIAIIHQELQYVPELTVMENLLLGHLPTRFGFVRRGEAIRWTRDNLQRLGVDIDPLARLIDLSIGQRQMVEICKAVLRDATVIALDEPTSSLSHRESEILFRMIRDLKARGKALIYISHRLEEIFELCDGCTIFRDGRKVAEHHDLSQITRDQLVQGMVGREIKDIFDYKPRALGEVAMTVQNLSGKKVPTPATFSVRKGEILGFFGLVGAGRSELMRLIYGADVRATGTVELDGIKGNITSISQAIHSGLVLCPEDRKQEGIVPGRSVSENINISCRRHYRRAHFFVNDSAEAGTAEGYIKLLRIKTPSRHQEIRFLSGGNQQKAILARWLAEQDLRVLIIDEPTRGIDVGAKNEIYQVLYGLAEKGVAVIMVSSELPEVLGVSDRIITMCQGRITGELNRTDANERNVLTLALPVSAPTPAAAPVTA
ncbi:L-arabinose ABC transporter ATP-binding protein AraG [Amantichitinum ursilacus]|uniref:Arabinose import ATP-binding protein AraG n=1 Tax=Amantichitinum ursilacus TaxID=857265 RepID=A0A0N1JRS6_9NEIS|nr:L-arabinose ABC transporter ATP-binding protein AraG [Amantichitinum ursilacus]KPC49807.1 Arabinose import ATP-binding protein AraG [Amantichitinum ursilacus]